jgi:predicted SprT family Zn-dependent metalloprotease
MSDIDRTKARKKKVPLAKQSSLQAQIPLFPFTNFFSEAAREDTFKGNRQPPKLQLAISQESASEAWLQEFAEESFERLLPFFLHQKEGSIVPNIKVELSKKMEQKIGLSYLFERVIRLNLKHFSNNPSHLPYTLFHEMTHVWLYDCDLDPNHTWRFYRKMEEFSICGLPVDPAVHIHTRVAAEAKCVYSCPNCENRWYLRSKLRYPIYCGPCYDANGVEHYANLRKTNAIAGF